MHWSIPHNIWSSKCRGSFSGGLMSSPPHLHRVARVSRWHWCISDAKHRCVSTDLNWQVVSRLSSSNHNAEMFRCCSPRRSVWSRYRFLRMGSQATWLIRRLCWRMAIAAHSAPVLDRMQCCGVWAAASTRRRCCGRKAARRCCRLGTGIGVAPMAQTSRYRTCLSKA